MIGLFRRSGPVTVPVLVMLSLLLFFNQFYAPVSETVATAGGMLDNFLYKSVHPRLSSQFLNIITLVILVLSALFANYVLVSRRMYSNNHMLAALCMVLFTGLFPAAFFLHAGIVLLPITIWLYTYMLRLYNTPTARSTIINMGLLSGTATLLYHPYWWMLLVCFFALGQMRPFKVKEWVLLLFSFFTPVYFVLAYDFLSDQWQPSRHWPVWNPIKELPGLNTWVLVASAIAIVWCFYGLGRWQTANRRMLIQVRKSWYILLFMGILILPSMVFPRNNVSESLIQLSFPMGAIAAHAFAGAQKSWLQTLLFWLLVIAAGVMGWARSYYHL